MYDDPVAVPSSPHTEIAVLGAMLLDVAAVHDATATLRPEDFCDERHKRIYGAMRRTLDAGHPLDYLTVRDALSNSHELDAIGGPAYLAFLTEGIPRNLNIESYVRIVKDKSRLRAAQSIAHVLNNAAGDQGDDADTVVARAINDLQLIQEDGDDEGLERVGDFLTDEDAERTLFEKMATTQGINFGFAQFDEAIGGAQPASLIIIAARPSMGKTAMMANIAWHVSVNEGRHTAVFSLEQPRRDIIRRMLSAASRIDYKKIRTNDLRQQDKDIILERQRMLSKAPLYITERRGMTLSRIRSQCLKLNRDIRAKSGGKEKLDLILIDQLSKMSADDVYRKGMDLRQIIGKQTGGLKALAQELQVPVGLLCQLKRADDKKGASKPTLVDLKESGNIEEDADVVALLHRAEYYDRSDEALRGKAEIIIAKQREGETKTCHCAYRGNIMRWEDTTEHSTQQQSLPDSDYFIDPPPAPKYGGEDRVKW